MYNLGLACTYTGEALISRCEYDTLLPASLTTWSSCPWALLSQILSTTYGRKSNSTMLGCTKPLNE